MSRNVAALLSSVLIYFCATSAIAATQVPQVWTASEVPGEFPSQEAAVAAVRALGGPHALAERVEDITAANGKIIYVYGSNPRGPIIGPWHSYQVTGNPYATVATLQEVIDGIKTIWASTPGCAPVNVTVATDWAPATYWQSGDTTSDFRTYNVERFLYSACDRDYRPANNYVWRLRDIECPEHTTWNNAEKACLRKGLAHIHSRPLTCSDDCSDYQHNPVNVGTGDKYESETDFVLPWLTFKRHYHSAFSVPHAKLGPGWTHDLNIQLFIHNSTVATLIQANGNPLLFRNGYEAEDGSGWQIVAVNGLYELRQPSQTMKFSNGRLVEIDHLDGNVVSIQYDATNRLSLVAHSSGRSVTFEYGVGTYAQRDQLTAITSNGATLVSFDYDPAGRLTYARYPGTTLVNGKSRQYHHEDIAHPDLVTGITDEDDQRYSTFEYDANGYATASEHAGGVFRGVFDYRSDGSTVFTDPNGNVRTFEFSSDGAYRKVSEVSDAVGAESTSYELEGADFRRRPQSRTDKRGVTTTYSYMDYYDAAMGTDVRRSTTNEAVSTSEARTVQEWRTIAHGWLLKRLVQNEETIYQRNARGQVLTKTRRDVTTGSTRTTTSTYCEQADVTAGMCPLLGLVKSVDGPRTDVSDLTTYTYRLADEASCTTAPATCLYRKGDLWKITNALSHVTETLKYDGASRPLSMKSPTGVIADLEYHPRGWLTARKVRGTNDAVETDDQVTRIEYWPTGLIKKMTQPDGAFTSYTYDDAHRLTDIADNEGNSIHYALDNAGNRIGEETKDEQGALLRTLSRVYNQLGQLETQADADSNPTDFAYDANGNPDTVTDALARVTDSDYDPLNRLQRMLQDVGGIQAETTFAYDAQDNLTKVTDPKGLHTTYVYNGLGDLLELSSPDTGTTTYTYDSGGNRKTQVDARGITTTYTYDVLNRLTAVAYSDGSSGATYQYDTASKTDCTRTGGSYLFAKGRLSKMVDASGETQYCYDRFGNLAGKEVNFSSVVAYTYTPAGRLSSISYPDRTIVDYVRDAQGRVTEIGVKPHFGVRQVLLGQATYYPFGPAAEWVYGNGRLMHRSLNQNYQPGFVEDGFPGGISIGYQFDEVGNLEKLRYANQSDPPRQVLGYDDLNRLTEVKDGVSLNLLQGYGYDDTGNRTSATEGVVTTNYTYPATSHRLDAVGATARTYDAIGNTIAIGGTAKEFVYNAANRMRQVKQGGVVTMTYTYNGKGEQVSRASVAGTVRSFYDEAGHWLGDYNGSSPIQQVVWLDDLPVGLMTGTGATHKLYYVEPDALGTPRVVIDPSRGAQGTAVWSWDLAGEAFGNSAPNQDPDGDATAFVFDMRFPGQRYDAASGLNYNYFRDYEAATGRYVESDPIGFYGPISTYSYVTSNPFDAVDPNGLFGSGSVPVISCGGLFSYFTKSAGKKVVGELACPMPDDKCWEKCRCKHLVRLALCGPGNIRCGFNSKTRLEICAEVCAGTGKYPSNPNDETPSDEKIN